MKFGLEIEMKDGSTNLMVGDGPQQYRECEQLAGTWHSWLDKPGAYFTFEFGGEKRNVFAVDIVDMRMVGGGR